MTAIFNVISRLEALSIYIETLKDI